VCERKRERKRKREREKERREREIKRERERVGCIRAFCFFLRKPIITKKMWI
jgi:hypothetical protein